MLDVQRHKYFDLTALLVFVFAGAVLYSRTLQVPWLFDDITVLAENPLIRSIPATIRNLFAPRGLAYLSFGLNYQFGELNVTGYHLVNIALHISASWFAYLLAKRAFLPEADAAVTTVSPFLNCAPLLAGLIFLVHPLQTQTVNYIVQRMTGLSGLFFLMTVYCYVRYREAARDSGFFWYGAALAMTALAMMTKQNAAVLPVALLLFDWLVMNGGVGFFPFKRRLITLLPFFLISCFFVFLQVGKNDILLKDAGMANFWTRAEEASATKNLVKGQPPPNVQALARPQQAVKPPDNLQMLYFATEWSVLCDYLRLMVLPYGLTFDYGEPLVAKVVTVKNLLAGISLLLLAICGFLFRRRRPLLAFGILWFFVCLSVESTIIPLDAKVEHRLYLPLFGFALAVVESFRRLPIGGPVATALLCMVVTVYAVAGWNRNALWSDQIAFALDGRAKAPHNQRTHLTLATAYADAGRWLDAEQTLRRAIPLRPYYYVPYDNLGAALAQQGKYGEARGWFSQAAILKPDYPNAVYNYGWVSLQLGDISAALRSLERLKEMKSPLARQLGAQFTGR